MSAPFVTNQVVAISKASHLAIEGLRTDGGHHKQWYLEQILAALGWDMEEFFEDEIEINPFYRKGIAP